MTVLPNQSHPHHVGTQLIFHLWAIKLGTERAGNAAGAGGADTPVERGSERKPGGSEEKVSSQEAPGEVGLGRSVLHLGGRTVSNTRAPTRATCVRTASRARAGSQLLADAAGPTAKRCLVQFCPGWWPYLWARHGGLNFWTRGQHESVCPGMGQRRKTTSQELPMTPPQLCPAITELGWRWGRPEFAASFLTAQHSESSGPSDDVPGVK